MNDIIQKWNDTLEPNDVPIVDLLAKEIDKSLPEASSKIWHGSPVWFIDDNPIVGYARRKAGINLLFWSGQSFDEPGLSKEGSFKAAEKLYKDVSDVNTIDLARWLEKSARIQWDYKNIVKRKGVLERLK